MPALNLTAVVSRRMLAPDESPDDILCDMESMVGAVRRAAGAKHGGERSFAVTTCYDVLQVQHPVRGLFLRYFLLQVVKASF